MKRSYFQASLLLVVLFLSVSHCICHAQAGQGLGIGDQIPGDLMVPEVYDRNLPVKLADMHGNKLLLIDFWATWCGPCVKGLPELDLLRTKFKEKLSVISVTYEPKEKVSQFFGRHPKLAGLSFPFVVNDKALSTLFPHQMVPHIVWISASGKVVAITGKDEVTAINIQKMLDNTTSGIREKHDLIDFDFQSPLTADHSEKLYSSLLVRTIPGIGSRGYTEANEQGLPPMLSLLRGKLLVRRLTRFNSRIASLFINAGFEGKLSSVNRSRMVLEVKDSSSFFPPSELSHSKYSSYPQWKDENLYCYELSVPDHLPASKFYECMLDDLNRYFPFQAAIEKRQMPCYVLTWKGGSENVPYSSKVNANISGKFNLIEGFEAMTVQEIVDFMNFDQQGPPVLNETGIQGLINLPIRYDFDGEKSELNFIQLQNNFRKLGFELSKVERLIQVLVVRDKS